MIGDHIIVEFKMFTMSKIQIFESNSQLLILITVGTAWCLRCQRYKFLKAIHNKTIIFIIYSFDVYDVKDTNFWKQFTTVVPAIIFLFMMFTMSKIQIFESNSQRRRQRPKVWDRCLRCQRYKFLKAIHNCKCLFITEQCDVYDVKDTNFWKQFTTSNVCDIIAGLMFTMSKIQIFESNSQQFDSWIDGTYGCLRCQRYKFLKAIHNQIS